MSPGSELLHLSGLRKSFPAPDGGRRLIIDVPDFTLAMGEHIALRGESGSGKTTFLNLISGILAPDSGSIRIGGADMAALGEHRRDLLRGSSIGYIFQTFNLLQGYSCLENVMLGMTFGVRGDRSQALALLGRVGLSHRLNHVPRQLSSGQQQRVAVAARSRSPPSSCLPTSRPATSTARTRARRWNWSARLAWRPARPFSWSATTPMSSAPSRTSGTSPG